MKAQDTRDDAPADEPVVIGVGSTGARIASLVAARDGRALRCLAVVAAPSPAGPAAVPALEWPEDPRAAALAADDLRERTQGARGAVLVLSLAADATVTIAPGVARALRPRVGALSAVGVAPFSFEGPGKAEAAQAGARVIRPGLDFLAVAEREGARGAVPADTALEKACAFVDDVAALSAGIIARLGADAAGLGRALGGSPGRSRVGAGEARGDDAVARAARAAVGASILAAEALASARGAALVLALGRTPTLGEMGAAEAALRKALPEGASVAAMVVPDPSLGERALAAVVCAAPAVSSSGREFPSEEPETLEIPAYLRRRSAGVHGRGPGARRSA